MKKKKICIHVTETFITMHSKCIELCGFDSDRIIVEMLLSTLYHHIPDVIVNNNNVSSEWMICDHEISIYSIPEVLSKPDSKLYFHNSSLMMED